MTEISRVRDIDCSRGYTMECPGCGRSHVLHFNGGELDAAYCCHYLLRLDSPTVDAVIFDQEPR